MGFKVHPNRQRTSSATGQGANREMPVGKVVLTTVALRTAQVDLTNCDREPIHLSGAIQPHGILIALDNADLRVAQVSNNAEGMLGFGPAQILGSSIEQILGTRNFDLIRNAAQRTAIEDGNPVAMTVSAPRGEIQVDAVLNRSSGQIVV